MNSFITNIGKTVSWLSLVIVLIICLDVLCRYLFSATQVWLIELEWYLFGVLFLCCGAWTWLCDRHVRVDVFYNSLRSKDKEKINKTGHVLLALPWILIVIYSSFIYSKYSFELQEGSPDPGGLPARYAIKFCICLAFILMLLGLIDKLFQRNTD